MFCISQNIRFSTTLGTPNLMNCIEDSVQLEFSLAIKKIPLYLWSFLTNEVTQHWKKTRKNDTNTQSDRFVRGKKLSVWKEAL